MAPKRNVSATAHTAKKMKIDGQKDLAQLLRLTPRTPLSNQSTTASPASACTDLVDTPTPATPATFDYPLGLRSVQPSPHNDIAEEFANAAPPPDTLADEEAASDDKHVKEAGSKLSAMLQEASAQAHKKEEELGDEGSEFKEAMEAGFAARGAMGLRFLRSSDGGKCDEYKNLKSNSEKARFRQQWAATKYQEVVLSKEKSTSWQKIDCKKGVYLPFEVIVEKEGGGSGVAGALASAVKAAEAYCEKAIKMGGAWTRRNSLTERQEYLYLRYEMQEEFKESWTAYEKQSQSHSAAEVGHNDAKDEQTTTTTTKTSRSSKEPAKASGDKNKDITPKTPRTPTDIEKSQATAALIKKNLESFFSQYYSISTAAEKDPAWKWAARNMDDLNTIKKDIEQAMSSFGRNLMALSMKELRRQHADEDFVKETQCFDAAIQKHVAQGLKEVRIVLRMHRGRQEA